VTGRLHGQVCLVTGAARGIGKGIARRFLDEGARVWICDVRQEDLETALGDLARSGQVAGSVADVSRREQVEAMMEAVVASWGRLDVLVNNAGIACAAPILEAADADWDRVIAVNLRGTFICLQAAARLMAAQRRGVVLNIASTNGLRGQPTLAAYGASKAGIINLTQTAALELGSHGIRVNAICPATTWTELSASVGWDETVWAELRAHTALGRLGTVEDVAAAAAYLASDDAAFVTGVAQIVDGGLLARQVMIAPERLQPPREANCV
jgi:NAD(P)-dependent dehydrogenase (short-subunit alcohol dehydrogenase family)